MVDIDGLYKRAEEALGKRNYDYARDLYLQIIAVDRDSSAARKGLKTALSRKFQEIGGPSKFKVMALTAKTQSQLAITKDPKRKVELAQNHLNDDPENSKVRYALAEALMDTGYSGGAIAELENIIESAKEFIPAYKLLGTLYKDKGLVKEADEILHQAERFAPEDREIGRLLRDLAAISTMQKGFEDSSSFRDVLKDKDKAAELEKAQHLIKSEDDIQDAIDVLQKELEQNPQDFRTVKKIADIYYDKKKDYSAARDWYKKAAELNPQDSSLKNRGDDCTIKMFEIQIGKLEPAGDARAKEVKKNKLVFEIQSYERRVKDSPTDMALRYELGKRYYTAGMIDKSIGEFQQSVKDPKRKVDSHFYLGMAFKYKKMFDLAANQFEKSLVGGLVSHDKKLLIEYNMALSYAESGDLTKAMYQGKKIMEVDINYKDISQLVEEWTKKLKGN